jgi:RNA polymerase sigma-70 factor, ECF subfamily
MPRSQPTAPPGTELPIEMLLEACRTGDASALDRLFHLLYDELRIIAHRHLRSLHGDGACTLNTTALVHESYLKLAGGAPVRGSGRAQFFAVASRAMRSILVDYARRGAAAKRGGDLVRVTLQEGMAAGDARAADLLAVDAALTRLAENLPRLAQVIECRFFGGMTVAETAEALDISPRTVERDWTRARAYLATILNVEASAGQSNGG